MANEGQQSPLPEQEPDKQAEYYGWQYDQDDVGEPEKRLPQVAPGSLHLPVPQPPPLVQPLPSDTYPEAQNQQGRPPQLPVNHQTSVHDMGRPLGYGQQRLQQLQEERMRRQQSRTKSEITTLIPWKRDTPSLDDSGEQGPSSAAFPQVIRHSTERPEGTLYQNEGGGVHHLPLASLAPLHEKGSYGPEHRAPASESLQDTGMIQKVRVGRATFILTGAFIASRCLGLIRTSMFASVFGTSVTSDAYLQAFLIPDLIFNIVAGGALASAFIPVFTKYMIGEKDEKTAWHISSSALNLAMAIMVFLAIIAIILAPWLVPLYNPGLHDPAELALIASLTRIMLLQAIVLGVGVIVNAVLNARQNFLLPAIGTVVYNVGLIIGLLPGLYFVFRGQHNDIVAVYAATWGVVIGALLQVGVQIPGLFKVGMRYTPSFDWKHPGVVQIGRQMVPRIINAAMLYLSTFVDRGLIQVMVGVIFVKDTQGLITQYYQAMQLMLLPLGIFGMAVSTAAFPTLAENVTRGRLDRVRSSILETVRNILFMSIPSAIGLIVLGFPIIQVLLEHGSYTLSAAQSTAVPLAFFALGLPGLAAVEILTRSFYAMRDSKTPVIISVGQFVFKILLSFLLIRVAVFGAPWGMGALAFSTSLAGTFEAMVLFYVLNQRLGELQVKNIVLFVGRVVTAALTMGFALLLARSLLDLLLSLLGNISFLAFLDTTRYANLKITGTLMAFIKLLIELFIGVFVYVRMARFMKIDELGPIKRILDRLKLSWI